MIDVIVVCTLQKLLHQASAKKLHMEHVNETVEARPPRVRQAQSIDSLSQSHLLISVFAVLRRQYLFGDDCMLDKRELLFSDK